MADRLQYFYRQRVNEAELNLGFALLEQADRNLAADLGIQGIISGAVPMPHEPVADLSIDLTPPGRAYDPLGRRIFFGSGRVIDCSVDHNGNPTEVPTPDQERWLGVYLRFDRLPSDPRTDGHSQEVFSRQDESFRVVVRQGVAAGTGTATRVPLVPDELLLCDVLRLHGQTQILGEHIDITRRQALIIAQGDSVAITSGLWSILHPGANTVQAALDAVDGELAGHVQGTAHRHLAAHVDFAPHGSATGSDVQGAMEDVVDAIDGHVAAEAGAHAASAISAEPHEHIAATTVQGQLQEVVSDLQSTTVGQGASHVGNPAVAGDPYPLAAGTVSAQLGSLLGHVNHLAGDHASLQGDHDTLQCSHDTLAGNHTTLLGSHDGLAAAFAIEHQQEEGGNNGKHKSPLRIVDVSGNGYPDWELKRSQAVVLGSSDTRAGQDLVILSRNEDQDGRLRLHRRHESSLPPYLVSYPLRGTFEFANGTWRVHDQYKYFAAKERVEMIPLTAMRPHGDTAGSWSLNWMSGYWVVASQAIGTYRLVMPIRLPVGATLDQVELPIRVDLASEGHINVTATLYKRESAGSAQEVKQVLSSYSGPLSQSEQVITLIPDDPKPVAVNGQELWLVLEDAVTADPGTDLHFLIWRAAVTYSTDQVSY